MEKIRTNENIHFFCFFLLLLLKKKAPYLELCKVYVCQLYPKKFELKVKSMQQEISMGSSSGPLPSSTSLDELLLLSVGVSKILLYAWQIV